jgi:hypothetical protein
MLNNIFFRKSHRLWDNVKKSGGVYVSPRLPDNYRVKRNSSKIGHSSKYFSLKIIKHFFQIYVLIQKIIRN